METALTAPADVPTLQLLPPLDELQPSLLPYFLAGLLLGRFEMADWPRSSATEKRLKPSPDDLTAAVGMALNYKRNLCYVRAINGCYLEISPNSHIYIRVPDERLEELVMEVWAKNISVFGSPSAKKVKEAAKMAKAYAKDKMDSISRRYIAVGPQLFWDTQTATLTDRPKQPVFFRLFDTDHETVHIRKVAPFTKAQLEVLQKEYTRNLNYLLEHRGDLPEEFSFVQLWANFSHDMYMDIMKASAAVFMKKKPVGAFMPIGLKRNGKTAWSNDLMKTMLGDNNTSSVQLSELGNYHQTKKLQWTLYNAPDEEKEGITQYITDFKTITDHGKLDKDQMYSPDPIPIDCDFVCVCPMNHMPQWEGDGAPALAYRSLILPFTHSFPKEDSNPVPFAERTFTADMFSHFLGALFALATYFYTVDMQFSPILEAQRQAIEEEHESHITYFQHFIAFFDGFASIKQIYDDYRYWCNSAAHDVPQMSLSAFRLAFAEFTKQERKNASVDGVRAKVYRIARPNMKPYIENGSYGGWCPAVLHNRTPALSIVERLEAALEEDVGEEKYPTTLQARIIGALDFIQSGGHLPTPEPPEQPTLGDSLTTEEEVW